MGKPRYPGFWVCRCDKLQHFLLPGTSRYEISELSFMRQRWLAMGVELDLAVPVMAVTSGECPRCQGRFARWVPEPGMRDACDSAVKLGGMTALAQLYKETRG